MEFHTYWLVMSCRSSISKLDEGGKLWTKVLGLAAGGWFEAVWSSGVHPERHSLCMIRRKKLSGESCTSLGLSWTRCPVSCFFVNSEAKEHWKWPHFIPFHTFSYRRYIHIPTYLYYIYKQHYPYVNRWSIHPFLFAECQELPWPWICEEEREVFLRQVFFWHSISKVLWCAEFVRKSEKITRGFRCL